ncbi:NAD(P)/FAD-dependent oxidoreductase [Aestuariibacter salexigens]|uniref:NAD(P)/FAD-dependent oxidoreductase n=1 Tax=Aestuariibacter salexigens TaxID=226010 RepID=UPI000402C994|nr:FAD-dependent oxidoreductase [Aestuariibacter salexigens]
MGKRIAIIGSGISGLTCAYLLHRENEITVFESNDYVGGHTATKDVHIDGRDWQTDTGFIVYNDWTYPNFIKLMDQLGVRSQPTEMSFSVKNLVQNLEYNGHDLNTLFAQRRNIIRPRFIKIVRDILRFNKQCKALLESDQDIHGVSLGDFLTQHGYSQAFADNYILPMCAAIWSASLAQIKRFPLPFFLQFFNNHGLLNVTDRPQWRTLIGGSRQYIAPLTKGYAERIHLNSPVTSVEPQQQQYLVTAEGHEPSLYDEVIFACHSDQALKMLASPTQVQQDVLGSIPYAMNEVVLHTDTRLLPERKLAWASWNYLIKGYEGEELAPASVTYNMNILQRLDDAPVTFCVTLNNSEDIDPDKILGKYHYAHPQFSQKMVEAQRRRGEICGQNGLHFCGAYWYNGFHEDGVRSALDVCNRFGRTL